MRHLSKLFRIIYFCLFCIFFSSTATILVTMCNCVCCNLRFATWPFRAINFKVHFISSFYLSFRFSHQNFFYDYLLYFLPGNFYVKIDPTGVWKMLYFSFAFLNIFVQIFASVINKTDTKFGRKFVGCGKFEKRVWMCKLIWM